MQYRFFEDTESKQFITNFTQEPQLRPQVKDIVTFPPTRTKWVITREEVNSTSGSTPKSFDYFVRVQDTSPDTISLRKSNDNAVRKLQGLGAYS